MELGILKNDSVIDLDNTNLPTYKINIADKATPLVLFIGPEASGKTIALMRMTRYLTSSLNYSVIPDIIFRKHDHYYSIMCERFREAVWSDFKFGVLRDPGPFLIKVVDEGKSICQIIDIPGDMLQIKSKSGESYHCVNEIFSSTNKKIWVLFIEQGWGDNQEERELWVQYIHNIQKFISGKDKVLFLFSKADYQRARGQYSRDGKPIKKLFFDQIKHEYPGLFDCFLNTGISKFIHGKYNFSSICFSAGVFSHSKDGRDVFTMESDEYCKNLWKILDNYK